MFIIESYHEKLDMPITQPGILNEYVLSVSCMTPVTNSYIGIKVKFQVTKSTVLNQSIGTFIIDLKTVTSLVI